MTQSVAIKLKLQSPASSGQTDAGLVVCGFGLPREALLSAENSETEKLLDLPVANDCESEEISPPPPSLRDEPGSDEPRNPYASQLDAASSGRAPEKFEPRAVIEPQFAEDYDPSVPTGRDEMPPLPNSRHELIAHMAAAGLETNVIASELSVTLPWASHVKNLPATVARTQYLQAKLWNKNHKARFQKSIGTSLDVLEGVIAADSKEKTRDKIDVAKFLLEKTTGKAPAVIEVKGELLVSVLDRLDTIRNVTPQSAQREATPLISETVQATPKQDSIDSWVEENLE
jgi:hypothetical protein